MIIVGMSGGVDSSVTALVLKNRGEQVRGVFMKNWETNDPACRAEEDRKDALRVCGMLDIPFVSRNFADVYMKQVFEEFLSDWSLGLTPNPDILCNREVKFKVFLEDALAQGAERIATGHYVRKVDVNGVACLARGRDPKKDQSYFLHAITQEALNRSEFPIGDIEKSQVRAMAAEAGLLTARKKDSTGICFIGEHDFRSFLSRYLPAHPGPIVTEEGRVLGQHQGALYYTLGQKVGLGGIKGYPDARWVVLDKRVQDNTLVVVPDPNHEKLWKSNVVTRANTSWIAGRPPASNFRAEVQLAHLGTAYPASVKVGQDGELNIAFDNPVRCPTPGQSAVIYQGEVCLGGSPMVSAF